MSRDPRVPSLTPGVSVWDDPAINEQGAAIIRRGLERLAERRAAEQPQEKAS